MSTIVDGSDLIDAEIVKTIDGQRKETFLLLADQIISALSQDGFVQIINHGIPNNVIRFVRTLGCSIHKFS